MKRILIPCLIGLYIACTGQSNSNRDCLTEVSYGFENIQDSTRTKTWWFHGETETTREGITADLEAYKRQGIGGVVYYDQSHGKAERALPGFSPEWWEMLRFSAEEAQRLGLSFEVHISNGFVAGGAWITDEHSMKRLAATEQIVSGGAFFEGKLKAPTNKYGYSKDVAVLAFPVSSEAGASTQNRPFRLSSHPSTFPIETLFDPEEKTLTRIPIPGRGKSVYINLEFEEEFTARSISYEVRPKGKATTSATNVPAPP